MPYRMKQTQKSIVYYFLLPHLLLFKKNGIGLNFKFQILKKFKAAILI